MSKNIREKFFVYSWHLDEKETEQTVIRAYGLDINNNSVCLKILNFQPFIYVELPIIKGLDWNQYTVGLVSRKIDDICGKFKPLEKHFVFKKKLYYANVEKNSKTGKYEYKMYPYLKLLFSTNEDIKKFTYKIKSPISIVTMGKINLRAHEQDANAVLQLTCVKKIPTCGWIEFLGKEQLEYDKETRCNREFIVNYNNMKSIDIRSVPEPLVMGFDIEVNSVNPNVMPKPNKPGNKIFQISCVFYKGGEYERYLLSLGEPDPETVGDDVEIRMFNNETTLLIGYTQLINEKNPNVIVGYNIFNFDLPYMIDRAKGYCQCISEFDKQGFLVGRNSKEKQISWSSGAYGKQEFKFLDAEGRLFVDLLPIVKRDYKFDSYTLKNVSTFFLGETKDPLSPKGIFKCYRVGMQGGEKGSKALGVCGKYVVQDAALTVKLFEKIDVWLGSTEMARICNVPIFYLYTQGQQIKVYSQIYLDCMYKDIIVEKDGYLVNEDDHYTGAKVFPPVPGAYDKVVPFDFTSLYPTTIIAHNIDYSTLVVDENIPDEDCHVIEWDEHTGCKHDTEVRKTKPKAIVCNHYKFRFLKEPMGVMPTKLKYLLEARDNTKKKMKEVKDQIKKCTDEKEKEDLKKFVSVLDKRQLAYKVSANSMYGAMGVKKGYLPFLPGAMCTTARGRQSIEKAAKTIQEEYNGHLVYGDSVASYTPVYVKVNNIIDICTIEELGNKYGNGNWKTCIEIGKQDKEYCELDGLETWTEKGWTKLYRIIRHTLASHKKMIRVLTHTGVVDVTDDHSLIKKDGTEISPKDVKIGTELLHHLNPEVIENITNITEEESEIMGFFFGDGSCGEYNCKSGKKSSWALNNSNENIINKYYELCRKVYPDLEWVIMNTLESSGVYKISPKGKYGEIVNFVKYYREKLYSGKSKIIPIEIMNGNKNIRLAFLRGLYDADGDKENDFYTRIDQKTQLSSSHIAFLISSLGWSVSINTRYDKNDIYRVTMTKSSQRKNTNAIKKLYPIDYEGYVYDLTTENHHFAAGVGKLIVHNTDSNYVHFPKIDTAQELWDYCIEVQEKISELFPKPMKMLFEEKIYWRFFILTKKRYMGLTCGRDGILSDKIDKKGVLLARRDNSAFIRKLYEKVMMGIFNRQDKNTVINMIIDELNLMFTNHYPIKDFIITKSVGDIDSYKIRELPTDPKKLEKRLLEMGLDPELKKMPSSNPQFKNRFEEEYMLKSLPSQVQLAEKLRRRGMRIDVGTRLPYVIIHTGNLKAKLADKLEDPEYVKEHSDIIRIDYLYYLKLLINPLDQALEVAYNIKKFTDNQYKLRLQKYKIATDTFSSKINFIE